MANTQSITITNADGIAFTVHGVPNGATLQLHTEPTPTPTVPTVAEPIPTVPTVDEVDDVDDTETAPRSTVAPKGVNRSEGKRYSGRKPQSKSGPIKGKGKDPITSTAPRSPLQQAGNAKTRHGKYASVKTATEWLALATAAVDALSDPQSKADERKLATATERYTACLAQLRSEGYVTPKGKTVKA